MVEDVIFNIDFTVMCVRRITGDYGVYLTAFNYVGSKVVMGTCQQGSLGDNRRAVHSRQRSQCRDHPTQPTDHRGAPAPILLYWRIQSVT